MQFPLCPVQKNSVLAKKDCSLLMWSEQKHLCFDLIQNFQRFSENSFVTERCRGIKLQKTNKAGREEFETSVDSMFNQSAAHQTSSGEIVRNKVRGVVLEVLYQQLNKRFLGFFLVLFFVFSSVTLVVQVSSERVTRIAATPSLLQD